MKKQAIILPGIGYHKDKPLLYYSAKLAQSFGYEIFTVSYHDMPQKIRGNAEKMPKAAALACHQTEEQLADADLPAYDEILLIGKSIGTIAAAKFAAEYPKPVKQIWYTPLNETFSFTHSPAAPCIAFLGDADPWSVPAQLIENAAAQKIPLYLYPKCNHSLECDDIIQNIQNLREIMQLTADFIRA